LLQEDPADVQALQALAEIANERKDKDACLTYLHRILEHQPQDFPARLLLAKVELASGDATSAAAQAEALAAEWPEDLNVQYVLAQSLRAAGRTEEAKHKLAAYGKLQKNLAQIEALMRDVRSQPAEPQLRYKLGLLLLRHVSRSEGVAWLQSVFQFDPRHADAHRALAEYYGKVGDRKLAQQHERLAVAVSQD